MSTVYENLSKFYGASGSKSEPIQPYNDNTLGEIYIIHFDRPWITSDGRTLEHYVGFSKQVEKRLHHHRKGSGANFLREAITRGISFRLVVRFSGTKRDERRLKVTGHIKKYCPCCNPDKTWKFKPNVLPHEYHYTFTDL